MAVTHGYTGEEYVEFQRRVIEEGGNMSEVLVTPGSGGLHLEIPKKPPYKDIHEQVHETKPALEFRGDFQGTEDYSEVPEDDDVRDPENPNKEYNLIKVDTEKFIMFGNGSVIKIPILGKIGF